MRERSLFTSDLSVNEFLLVRAGRLRAARARRRDLDLPHRLPDGGVEPEPGDGRPHPGDVPRARARDDAHGGGGRPARRRRDRRPCASTSAAASGATTSPSSSPSAPPSRHREGELHRAPNGRPFTSDLSGQDFCTLLSAGYRPVGHGHGDAASTTSPTRACATGCAASAATSRCPTSPRRSTTRASWRWSACRPRPRRSRPRAIVGVQLVEGNHGWGAHVLEYFSVGTAVIPTSDTHEIPPPTLTLTLNDSRQDRLTGF